MASTDTDKDALSDDADSESTEEQKPKLTLTVEVKEPSACERHVSVSISREDIDRYFQEKFDELMPDAEVAGFRKGKAPRKLVENKFKHQMGDQVKGSLLMDSIAQVSEEQDFSAISEPDFDFDAVKVPDEGPMTYEFNLEVRPEFDMPQWKGLKLEKPVRKFTKKDVDDHLKNLLRKYADLVPHKGAADADDYVTVDITFRHEGKVVSKVNEQECRIRPKLSLRDGVLTGFDKLMTGAKEGDKKEAKIKVSADADDEALRGKNVEVEFEVLDVKRLELPKITPELLEKVGGFGDEGELRDAVQNELERQLAYHENRRVREQITDVLTESAKWELPPDLLRRQANREVERTVMELRSSGFSDEQIQAYENELRQNSLKSTETALKEHFILERIAEDEEIEDTPEDYDNEIAWIAMQQGETPRAVRARLEKRGMMDTLRNQIIERKAIDLITSEANFKETKFKLPGNDTEAIDLAVSGSKKETAIPDAKPEGISEELPETVDHT